MARHRTQDSLQPELDFLWGTPEPVPADTAAPASSQSDDTTVLSGPQVITDQSPRAPEADNTSRGLPPTPPGRQTRSARPIIGRRPPTPPTGEPRLHL